MERAVFTNCLIVIFQIVEDLTSARRLEVGLLGHNVRFKLEPQPLKLVREMAERPIQRCDINTEAVDEMVEELLQDPDVNLYWVPDSI